MENSKGICEECFDYSEELFMGLCSECLSEKLGLATYPVDKKKNFDDELTHDDRKKK